jgi:hypothetical protein
MEESIILRESIAIMASEFPILKNLLGITALQNFEAEGNIRG